MKQQKHTPGPWSAPLGTSEIHDADGDLVLIYSDLQNEADLRLIAAAPQLFYMLGILTSRLGLHADGLTKVKQFDHDLVKAALDLLAKARGEK